MNYRHAYHAGNFADVLKHAALALIIEHLKAKPAPFRVIDTHAGTGLTDLGGPEAGRTQEWRGGIGKLIGPDAEAPPAEVAPILAPFLEAIRSVNPDGGLRFYPGSPAIALHALRPADRLMLIEKHPEDCAALSAFVGRDRRAKVFAEDGYTAMRSLLPPPERRGLVLMDPPYEEKDEYVRLAGEIEGALGRFASGTYLAWYPVKDLSAPNAFFRRIEPLGLAKSLRIELHVRSPVEPGALNGCGLLVVNPPWTLAAQLEVLLPFLANRLGQARGSGWRVDMIG